MCGTYTPSWKKIAGKISGANTCHVRAEQWAKARYRYQKANLGSEDSAIVYTSYAQEGPAIFYNGPGCSVLPGFPTKVKDWNPDGVVKGMRGKIMEWLPTVEGELHTNILELVSSYEGQCLARALLTEMIAGACDLCHFVDEAIGRTKDASADESTRM